MMNECLHMELFQALHVLKTNVERLFEPISRTYGLTLLQIIVLAGINTGHISRINDVCQYLYMSQGNASTMCKRLEQDGFLRRERSHTDERVVTLLLTPRAAQVIGDMEQMSLRFAEQIAQQCPNNLELTMAGISAGCEMLDTLLQLNRENAQ